MGESQTVNIQSNPYDYPVLALNPEKTLLETPEVRQNTSGVHFRGVP